MGLIQVLSYILTAGMVLLAIASVVGFEAWFEGLVHDIERQIS